jgi:hypothetical protein
MRLLSTGPQRFANNTGTGGSSSDGSSGHASMSDSQTSGSPPAEYARLGANGAPGDALLNDSSTTNTNSTTSGGNANLSSNNSYKSVLKSVPEDESNVSSSSNLNNSASVVGGSSLLGSASARLSGIIHASESKGSPDKRSSGDTSLGSSGGKKSSRSRHRNKVKNGFLHLFFFAPSLMMMMNEL